MKKSTEEKAITGKAEKPAKVTPKKLETKKAPALGRFGHRMASMGNAIDDLLVKGVTKESAVATLMKDFDRAEAQAAHKFLAHVRGLPKKVAGVTVTVSETGIYKATASK